MSVLAQALPGPASSNSGHVRYAPKAEESSLPVICLCGLMATHMTSFARSSLLKGGTVPVRPCSTLTRRYFKNVHQRLGADALQSVEPACRARKASRGHPRACSRKLLDRAGQDLSGCGSGRLGARIHFIVCHQPLEGRSGRSYPNGAARQRS